MDKTKEYRKKWQKDHILRMRMYKLKWYYKNRRNFYLMRSKPSSTEVEEADLIYFPKNFIIYGEDNALIKL